MTFTVYQIIPETDMTCGSALIKVNGASVLFNAPGGFQRTLNSFSYGAGDLKVVIIEENRPELVEGLLGFLMTVLQTQEMFKGKIVIPEQNKLPIFGAINDFALDQIFGGEVLVCLDRMVIAEKDFSVQIVNKNGRLGCEISTSLESRSFDSAKLKELGLKGKVMHELTTNGFVDLPSGQRVTMDEVSQRNVCGNACINLDDQSSPYPSVFVATRKESLSVPLKENYSLFNLTGPNNVYATRDFFEFYAARTGSTLDMESPESKTFSVFPAKLYGFQQTEKRKRTIEELGEQVFKQSLTPGPYFVHTLGTGASVPNKYANVAATLIGLQDELILVDCGEATTQQMYFSPLNVDLHKLKAILITHEHADHYLGLAVLLNHMEKNNMSQPKVLCPSQVQKYLKLLNLTTETISTSSVLEQKVQLTDTISAIITKSDHCEESVSYLISDNQQTFFHSGDGRPIEPKHLQVLRKQFAESPLTIIHEATFVDEQEEADKRKHATVNELIGLKEQYQCDLMVFTHFSQRHCKEIITVPEKVIQAFDFMILPINSK